MGAASFHPGGQEGPALTVYLGAFRREALDRVGGYDEAYVRAQDWEMNHRIRGSGGLIWFTPGMEVTYRPRSTVKALASQTTRATEDIGRQIAEIQQATDGAVTAIRAIGNTIGELDRIAVEVAGAVEEQSVAAQAIGRNVGQASDGTATVSGGIDHVRKAVGETGRTAGTVLASARDLVGRSGEIDREIGAFLREVKSA